MPKKSDGIIDNVMVSTFGRDPDSTGDKGGGFNPSDNEILDPSRSGKSFPVLEYGNRSEEGDMLGVNKRMIPIH